MTWRGWLSNARNRPSRGTKRWWIMIRNQVPSRLFYFSDWWPLWLGRQPPVPTRKSRRKRTQNRCGRCNHWNGSLSPLNDSWYASRLPLHSKRPNIVSSVDTGRCSILCVKRDCVKRTLELPNNLIQSAQSSLDGSIRNLPTNNYETEITHFYWTKTKCQMNNEICVCTVSEIAMEMP